MDMADNKPTYYTKVLEAAVRTLTMPSGSLLQHLGKLLATSICKRDYRNTLTVL